MKKGSICKLELHILHLLRIENRNKLCIKWGVSMLFLTKSNEIHLCGKTACASGEELFITLLTIVVLFFAYKVIYKK
jgi:hypothetical protein